MPDITMCLNDKCSKRKGCHRYMAIPDKYAQSYSMFDCENNEEHNYFIRYKEKSK